MNNNIELAKKIRALAERGIGGEKINAQKLLESLLKKHNLTIEDIEGEKISDHYFKLKKEDERLWSQIVKHVNYDIKSYGPFPVSMIKKYDLTGNYSISCTMSEYIEIEAMNVIYQRLFKKELNTFYHAFCTANNLLATPKKPISMADLTVEELNELARVRTMARNIKSEVYRKQIEAES